MNAQLYSAVIAIGVIIFIIGILLIAGLFGSHHTLPYIVLVVGAIVAILGIIGMTTARRRKL